MLYICFENYFMLKIIHVLIIIDDIQMIQNFINRLKTDAP